jgi:uncharacterized protein (TIGR00304 family)
MLPQRRLQREFYAAYVYYKLLLILSEGVAEVYRVNPVVYTFGAVLIIIGIILIVAAIIATSTRSTKEGDGRVKAAGVIMIGPVPIIFGTDKKSVKTVLALALALVIAAIVAMLLFNWLLR